MLLFGLIPFSYVLTLLALRLSRKLGIQDVPNERSSHRKVTPRGGGISVVTSMLLALGALAVTFPEERLLCLALALPGASIAVIGFLDDMKGLSAKLRLGVHLFSSLLLAGAVLYRSGQLQAGVLLITTVLIGWIVNLTNFMDGIDGILGVETIAAAVPAAFLCAGAGDLFTAAAFLALAFSTMGFLFLNWPPAKIFMGDVGSGFIGFIFGGLMVMGATRGSLRIQASLILYGVFILDASYTLVVRVLKGQNPVRAHRDHAYQKLVRAGHSHLLVTGWTGAFTILWLVPWAWIAQKNWSFAINPWLCVGIAYAPLAILSYRVQAGVPQEHALGSVN